MNINRSGYYKWVARKNTCNKYEQNRILLTQLLKEVHEKHKVYGYHNLANAVRRKTGLIFSDNLIHKCCKLAGIYSISRKFKKPINQGKEHVVFKNIINNNWNAKKPFEVIVSDMTCFYQKGIRYEWTYMLDTYNNEILASSITNRQGSNIPYYDCLNKLKDKISGQIEPLILHTDQGSVYSSKAFYEAHRCTNIKRSMSRAGTPTDNPIIESLNGWIKEELRIDFGLKQSDNVFKLIEEYVYYFNYERTAWALRYKTPVQYKLEQGFIT